MKAFVVLLIIISGCVPRWQAQFEYNRGRQEVLKEWADSNYNQAACAGCVQKLEDCKKEAWALKIENKLADHILEERLKRERGIKEK